MSRHGPPPGEPYGSRPGSGDYGPPSDPWGQPPDDAWDHRPGGWGQPPPAGPPGYPGPRHADPGYLEPPPGGPPPPPPQRSVGLYAVVAVLVLLAAAGVGYALFLLSGDDDPGAGGTPGPAATGPGTATPDPSAPPGDNIGLSAAVAQVDDCLVNDGTTDQTQMRIVRCEPGEDGVVVYRVLAVVTEPVAGEDDAARHASAQAICADTEGYTHHYFELGEQTSFVLCMAELG